jgi:acetyl esterase/lipase
MTTIPSVEAQGPRVGPPPPFDPELAAALAVIGEQIPSSLSIEMIPALREGMALSEGADLDLTRDGTFEVEQRTVPGPQGAPDISLLICRPTRATAAVPVVYNVHGGGMVIGDNRTGIGEMLDWAQELGMAVVSVEYRLAPEHPHPALVEDC